jgi:hypothetical protein
MYISVYVFAEKTQFGGFRHTDSHYQLSKQRQGFVNLCRKFGDKSKCLCMQEDRNEVDIFRGRKLSFDR